MSNSTEIPIKLDSKLFCCMNEITYKKFAIFVIIGAFCWAPLLFYHDLDQINEEEGHLKPTLALFLWCILSMADIVALQGYKEKKPGFLIPYIILDGAVWGFYIVYFLPKFIGKIGEIVHPIDIPRREPCLMNVILHATIKLILTFTISIYLYWVWLMVYFVYKEMEKIARNPPLSNDQHSSTTNCEHKLLDQV